MVIDTTDVAAEPGSNARSIANRRLLLQIIQNQKYKKKTLPKGKKKSENEKNVLDES